MRQAKSKEFINELPVCPKCQKPGDRNCSSLMEIENGRRYLHSKWTCGTCGYNYTADINLDSDKPAEVPPEPVPFIGNFVKPLVIFLILLLTGCSIQQQCRVIDRCYSAEDLPDGVCLFTVRSKVGWYLQFEDSCYKWQPGDSVLYKNGYLHLTK